MSKGIDGVTSSDPKGTCRVLGDTVFALIACHFSIGYHLANWAIKIMLWQNI